MEPEERPTRPEGIRIFSGINGQSSGLPMDAMQTRLHEVAFLSNTFVRSPLALNNVEARIFALALGCLHQKQDTLAFRIHFNDITRGGSTGGKQYAELAAAQTRLTQPIINTSLKNGKKRRDAISLFNILSLDEGTNLITGEFNSRLKEHLLDLTGKFTTVELESLLTLKNAHSQRLFWIMRSYHNQTWEEPLPFETLREWLFGENSEQYADWTDFNRYVLKPAIEEFRAIGWQVDVTMQKRGRRVEALVFKMTSTRETLVPVAKAKKALTLTEIEEFRKMLEATYRELPALYDRLRLDFELKEYQAREVVQNIKDLTAYRSVTKVLHDVRIALANRKPIKSLPAYTLSQLKAVLPVYQTLGATPAAPATKKAPAVQEALRAQLHEVQERLKFVQKEAPTNLFSEQEKAARIAAIKAEIVELTEKLAQ
ncbi:replication initiation protein [Hymenobacter setariae]|jgi:plasmid replication initiation protein|uniref:Replication initiation protein n=2 Tax=Hymenobacter setariae TaxID=2594794 RepID=A0A558BK52_9BACT|nr:replication initiation protein [Hymenobacter setariae]